MGSVTCKHCGAINSVTSIPNNVEGYFILEKDLSDIVYGLNLGLICDEAIPATICQSCGEVTLDKKEGE